MMSPEEVYFAEQEFKRFEEIMNTKLYLTQEEYDFCFGYDKDIRQDTTYVGDSYGDYLNLRLYSEHDHEKKEFKGDLERGLEKDVYIAFERLVKGVTKANVDYVLKELVRKYSYLNLA
jgi:hypothetical protein